MKCRILPFLATCLLVCSAGMPAAPAEPNASRIVVNPYHAHQYIDGFGVNFNGTYFRESQKPLIDMLVDDLGATIFRFDPFGLSNWEAVNDDDDPNHMNWAYYNDRYSSPFFEASWGAARYLNAKGVRPFLALSGITPRWMNDDKAADPTHEVCTSPADVQKKFGFEGPYHLNTDMYGEFAEMAVSFLMYARNRAGIDFEYFSPVNETDCFPREGPRVDAEEMPALLRAIVQRMWKERLHDVKLAVVDPSDAPEFTAPILADEDVMGQVAVISRHTYGGAVEQIAPHVEQIRRSKYPNTRLWLTEYGELDGGFKGSSPEHEWRVVTMNSAKRLLDALNSGAHAALHWDAFDNYHEHDQVMTYYGLVRNDNHHYSPKKRYYAAKQVYGFVRPGARRIDAESTSESLTVSGFRDGASGKLIVVGLKQGGPEYVQVDAGQSGTVNWELYVTSPELDCAKVDEVESRNGVASFSLPEEAVFTLVGEGWR
jgi:glucuronoarabinoxylan endo-1,4-beta-xylanase